MYWDHIECNWTEFKGKVKEHWERITDEQLDVIGGKRNRLIDSIQEIYDITRDEAEKRLSDWQKFQKLDGGVGTH